VLPTQLLSIFPGSLLQDLNMELKYSPTSPYVRKVLVVANELGITDRLLLTNTDPRAGIASLSLLNPLSKIPTLITDSGGVMFDSSVICEYLNAEYGEYRLLPEDGQRRWEILTRSVLAQGILDAAILVRLEEMRPDSEQSPQWISIQLGKAAAALDFFNTALRRAPLNPDISQITLGCALGWLQFRHPHRPWFANRETLQRWYLEFSERPSMRVTAPEA